MVALAKGMSCGAGYHWSRRQSLGLIASSIVASGAACSPLRYKSLLQRTAACPYGADFERFRSKVLEIDRSFSPENRMRAVRLLADLVGTCGALPRESIHLELARILTLSGNAHTCLLNTNWQWLFGRVPLRFAFFGDTLYVGFADSDWRDLQDREVRLINGFEVSEIEAVWSRYQSGRRGWRRQFLYHFIESPALLHAAGLGSDPDQMTVTLRGADGVEESHQIKAVTQSRAAAGLEALIPPPRPELLHRLRPLRRPFSMTEPDLPFRFRTLPGSQIPFLQFRANIDFSDQRDITTFAEQISEQLETMEPQHIIVDQRDNWGGDLTTTRELMKALPSLVSGRIIVMTSGRTFSAGIASTAYVKQAGGDRVSIVGEPVGDELDFWAEGDLVALEGLEANLLYAAERHDYQSGCSGDECHPPIRADHFQIETLDPDHVLDPTHSAFLAGEDPVLEAATSLLS